MNDDEPNIPTNLPPPSDSNINQVKLDLNTLYENTKEIIESIEARRGTIHASMCRMLFAAAQEFVVIDKMADSEMATQVAKSGVLHITTVVAMLDESKEFKGIFEDVKTLLTRANTDWHSKGHMG